MNALPPVHASQPVATEDWFRENGWGSRWFLVDWRKWWKRSWQQTARGSVVSMGNAAVMTTAVVVVEVRGSSRFEVRSPWSLTRFRVAVVIDSQHETWPPQESGPPGLASGAGLAAARRGLGALTVVLCRPRADVRSG
eukprot:CAMPEP_0182531234 /NCGR_PEP_ID=MMETSP1323-20130603/8354_1 /TAXON_ID=236787 /ORGANISM="Florenciella parvula, Strain RCC1693" /LENGTH=137 /DNA_ID=CAMNT_0024740753 /DNA_START=8 /DNA_END=418 /DNA_ORIENTATION=-